MRRDYRIWNFSVCGIKNIQKPITISFLDDTVPTKKALSLKGSNVKAIYGLNGSGKTAVLTAVKILSSLLDNKDYLIEKKNVLPDLINFREKELSISVVFACLDDGVVSHVYRYSISLRVDSAVSIARESLEELKDRTVNGKWKKLYSITDGVFDKGAEKVLPEVVARTANLLNKSSLPSLMDIFEKEPEGDRSIIYAIIDCRRFARSISVFLANGDLHDHLLDLSIFENQETFERRTDEWNRFIDATIYKSLKGELVPFDYCGAYEDYAHKLASFIRIFKPELKDIEVDKRVFDEKLYLCEKIFVYPNTKVNFEFESTGIKKIVSIFSFLQKMVDGGIVFIDEMDANIHDVYLDRLIAFLIEEGKGQLCFTTHSLSPIKLLKKDKHSIDFLGEDGSITSWKKNGNYAPDKLYAEGMIPGSPFNFETFDFYTVFDVSKE